MNSSTPVLDIKGVGEKTGKLLAKLNIFTVGDLLSYFPKDYEQLNDPINITNAKPGETVSLCCRIATTPTQKKYRNLIVSTVIIKDKTGSMQLTFFNMPYINSIIHVGDTIICRGLVQSKNTALVMEQPKLYNPEEYQKLKSMLQPKYPLTKGLTNAALQKYIKQALSLYAVEEEYYPQWIISDYQLCEKKQAINHIHFPEQFDDLIDARRRLVFDEFFSFIYYMRQNKEYCAKLPNHYVCYETSVTRQFLEALPFELTRGQKKVWQEIRNDLSSNTCMNRLIQGDVGSGKTIVAILALLECTANGFQGAMMAPTEVLAVQHYENILDYASKYGLAVKPVLLVGSMTAKEKKEAYKKIEAGEANIIIGTQALIQEKVIYKSLALVITDEQHRFGVKQREALAQKGLEPHVLVMSATPIPRTLAIIIYGDLSISIIDELPANRLPIKNCVINTNARPTAYSFIEKEVQAGRQAYVICAQVEAGESEDCENVIDYTEKLRAALSPSINIAYLHGKMRPAEKNRIMEEFSKGVIQVLVSTTVIEVGINVPNATVMMVENAERFGLAQLHQLRGRVGRGEHQSFCIFISTNEKPETMKRLDILNHSNDGFFIASEDLKLRGPGDLFGIRQSGDFEFRIGDIYNDSAILKDASEAVDELLLRDSELLQEENKKLSEYFQNYNSLGVDFRTI